MSSSKTGKNRVPNWKEGSTCTQYALIEKYMEQKLRLGKTTPKECALPDIANLSYGAYRGGVLASDGKIYLVPAYRATATTWHYIDTNTGSAIIYTHGATCVYLAYAGGVLAPNERIYLVPYKQATATVWHYIDTTTGSVVAYTHGATCVNYAYTGGILTPDGTKIYLVPEDQGTVATWHYIDTTTGSVVAYTHGATSVTYAYQGGVLAPNGRIYLIPFYQATISTWHYIDTTTGSVVAYTHGATCVASAYRGGALDSRGRIYMAPYAQATASVWHYIDTVTGSVVAYTHGITWITGSLYSGITRAGDRMFFSPYNNRLSASTRWTAQQVSGATLGISYESSSTLPTVASAYDGTYLVKYNSYNISSGQSTRLKLNTPFSTTGKRTIAVNFAWYESSDGSAYTDKVEVQWSTDGVNWTTAGTAYNRYNATPGWKLKSQILPVGANNQATLYVAFLFTSNYGYNCYLDFADVTDETPAAFPQNRWLLTQVSGSTLGITYLTSSTNPTVAAAYDGTYLVRYNSYSISSGSTRVSLIHPFSSVGKTGLTVDFAWYEDSGYSGDPDRVEVQWSTNGVDWTTAGTAYARYNAVTGWKTKSQALPVGAENQTNLYVAFLFISDYGNNCCLDDAKVKSGATTLWADSFETSTAKGAILWSDSFEYYYINSLYLDTTTDTFVEMQTCKKTPSLGGGILAPSGRIYMIPYSTDLGYYFIDSGFVGDWNINLCTNPMFNKF